MDDQQTPGHWSGKRSPLTPYKFLSKGRPAEFCVGWKTLAVVFRFSGFRDFARCCHFISFLYENTSWMLIQAIPYIGRNTKSPEWNYIGAVRENIVSDRWKK